MYNDVIISENVIGMVVNMSGVINGCFSFILIDKNICFIKF